MAVTTADSDIVIETAMARRSSAGRGGRGPRKTRLVIVSLAIVLAIMASLTLVGPFSRWLSNLTPPQQVSGAGPSLRFMFPPETAPDRILLKTGVNIVLNHEDTEPDRIALGPPPGDLIGSFTWTVIPHQGSHEVRRLIGEAEWQGRVFKLCEAIDDQERPVPKYAERYFPVNNAGVRYRNPQRAVAAPFVEFLNAAIALIPAGQQPIGQPPAARLGLMAERLIPLCTGQAS